MDQALQSHLMLSEATRPIASLIDDREVIEIMISATRGVSYERRGFPIAQQSQVSFSESQLKLLGSILAKFSYTAIAIDDSQVLAHKADQSVVNVQMSAEALGWRFEYVTTPVSLDGTCITMRRIASDRFTLDDYLRWETLSPGAADLLRRMVHDGAQIVVSGATSSGKTTFLGALVQEIPLDQRIVTIERVGELHIPHESAVRMDCGRNAKFDASVALRSALRSRPDWIIVGEVRGPEAFEAIDAAESGHPGMLSIHAKDEQRALSRLATYMLEGRSFLDFPTACRRVAAGVEIVVQMKRVVLPDNRRVRRVTSISSVKAYDASTGSFVLDELFH